MKIMLINTLFYPNIVGGAEKSVQILAEELAARGYQVVVVSTAPVDEIKSFHNIKVYYVYHRNLYWGGKPGKEPRLKVMLWHLLDVFNPFMYHALRGIVEAEKPDVIHTNMLAGFSSAPWIAAKRAGIPVVHTLREYNLICERMSMFRKDHNCPHQCVSCRLATAPKRYLTNHGFVKHVAGLSNFIIERHIISGYFSGVPRSRIFNWITAAGSKPAAVRAEAGRSVKLLYLGRIDRPKGVLPVLETIKDLPGIELHLGGHVLDQEVKDAIDSGLYPNHIKFLGFVDPEQIIDGFDALIVPSLWHEPFGRVVIEAYQHGKPVIASRRGGLTEIVIDGETGFLFDPDEPDSLRELLVRISQKPELLKSMRDSIQEQLFQFDKEHTVQAYEGIYKTVTGRGFSRK